MSIGENIKNARKAKGLTQAELAAQLGLATGTIQQYELGKREPKVETVEKIAAALGVFPSDLLGWAAAADITIERLLKGEPQTRLLPNITITYGDDEPTMDDFTYALQNEAGALTEEDKDLLLSLARQLAAARRKATSEE